MDLVRILNPYFDFDLLHPFRMDATMFFVEICMNNQNPYNFLGEFVIPHHTSQEISSPKIEPSKDPRAEEDQLLDEVLGEIRLMDLVDEGDLLAPGVEPIGSKDEGDQSVP